MKSFVALFFIVGVLLLFPLQLVHAVSSPAVKRDHVVVSLVSELSEVSPNQNFYIGLKFLIERKWHIYWKNPGDSGTSPRVKWITAPTIGDFDWPAPEKIPLDPLANYGYEEEVILPMIVSVSEVSGQTLKISGQFEWLVCKVECIPGSAQLDLEIPVGQKPKDSRYAQEIQSYLKKVPVKVHDIKSTFTHDTQNQILTLNIASHSQLKDLTSAYFFPYDGNLIQHASPQQLLKNEDGSISLVVPQSESLSDAVTDFSGVVEFQKGNKKVFYELKPSQKAFMPKKKDLFVALLFAFLGGLILNLMPCVFPVISIKILSLIDLTKDNPKAIRMHGWLYTFGVLASFLVLSGVLLILQSLGQNLGWGFQLQSPAFVLSMILLFYLMALNLYGVFDIDGAFVNLGGGLANKKGSIGTFFTGVLAVIVATPCTAPFMGTALGVTLTMPPLLALSVYLSLGLGLAFPYLLLCYFPPLLKRLPKPGLWMKNLKQFLAFPMMLTVVWLLWVLNLQTSPETIAVLIGILVLIFFLFWLHKVWNFQKVAVKNLVLWFLGLASIVFIYSQLPSQSAVQTASDWEKFDPVKIESYVSQKQRVFIDFTAAWCLTCQVNKRLVLRTDKVLSFFNEKNVKLVTADWTNQDPIITEALKKLGRNSVPVYVYYDESGQQNILPEILTDDIIFKAIQ